MLRNLRTRRRPHSGVQVCAVISALLLLLSVSLLYTRLSRSQSHPQPRHNFIGSQNDIHSNPLISDVQDEVVSTSEDKIDELDIIEEDQQRQNDSEDEENGQSDQPKVSGYFYDHLSGAIRRAISKRSIDDWEDDRLGFVTGSSLDDRSKAAFASDDVPVDETVRRKVTEVVSVEDALLVKATGRRKASPLRDGWGDWFDKKSDFLRRDKMFKSNLEVLNPLNNPMLQDPDGVGVTTLTRGDRLVQKLWLNEFRRVPFPAKKPLSVLETSMKSKSGENLFGVNVAKEESDPILNGKREELRLRSETERAERRTLDENVNVGNGLDSRRIINTNDRVLKSSDKSDSKSAEHLTLVEDVGQRLDSDRIVDSGDGVLSSPNKSDRLNGELGQNGGRSDNMDDGEVGGNTEFSGHIYADGKRWGYYPGLHRGLSFSAFMNAFFRKGKCRMKVFMVWNSPPWMYSVRHQRGLESLLSQHRDACVVVFSETIELDFFKRGFVNDGYKVAVAMPNLDELLKDTPTHVFASIWFEWRKTKFYSTHYSELVRLAALYKYGGIYLDSDIIVLKALSSLNNSVGMEDNLTGSSLNGAVMAFRKHSPFIMECLKEFYMTYDDTRLRWNGADLLTRVAKKFLSHSNLLTKQLELNVQGSLIFFPIHSQNITRYFTAPATETEKAQQDALFRTILNESLTFHFWNSLTSALIPEPGSLVCRLIDHPCIHCSDML